MACYEFHCQNCDSIFEEILIMPEDVRQYSKSHPCGKCHQMAERIMSAANFNFTAPPGRTAGSGVHGQSGSHDLDYPSLDKAVGRSSDKKWTVMNERKVERDKARKKFGTNAVSTDGVNTVPTDSKKLKLRDKAFNILSRGKKAAEKKNQK